MSVKPIKKFTSVLCVFLTFLWSGLPTLISTVALADSFQDQFVKQRQVVRNLELQATNAMYATSPECDVFEIKFNALMSAAGMALAKNPDVGPQTPAAPLPTKSYEQGVVTQSGNSFLQKNATQNNQVVNAARQSAPTTGGNNANNLSDKTLPVLPISVMTGTAKDYGLDPQLAFIIDNSKKLTTLFVDTQLAADKCRPYYAASYDAEVALTSALSQWIALAQKADPVGSGSPTIEANGMWVATNLRRATHKVMHTTIKEIENECSGDLFIDQSIPNLFQGLANGQASLVNKSMTEIIRQSLCLDVRQSVALDKGISLAGAGAIMAFGKMKNGFPLKRLLESVIMAGAPILEINKPLGPTGLWVLTQSLLNKKLSSPEIWVLDKDSYLVSYGIIVAERSSPLSAVFPICTEAAPPPWTSGAAPLPSWLSSKIDTANIAAIAQSAQLNSNIAAKDLTPSSKTGSVPGIFPVDPNDAPLAYGYTKKTLKEMICPVDPSKIISAQLVVTDGPLNKGVQAKYCYKADVITDSYRGDHLGYANCSLPEMVKGGRVCKRELCDSASAPFRLPSMGDDGEMPPLPQGGTSCDFPTFGGVPKSCPSGPAGTAQLFVHHFDNQGCGRLDPLKEPSASGGAEKEYNYDFEPMEITGTVPPAPSAPEAPAAEEKEKPEKPLPDYGKPEKNNPPGVPQQTGQQNPAAWTNPNKMTLYQGLPEPKKQKFIFPKDDTEWKNYLDPFQKSKISSPQEYAEASKKLKELQDTFRQLDEESTDCSYKPPPEGCDQLHDAVQKVYAVMRELEDDVFNAGYSHLFDPINNDQDLRAILIQLRNMKNNKCGAICDKKAEDLETYIRKSPVFKKFDSDVRKAALDVLKNQKFKAVLKQAREKFMGKVIGVDAYDASYNAMLASFPKETQITLDNSPTFIGKNFLAMGTTDPDNRVTLFLSSVAEAYTSSAVFRDEATNVLIHENGLHVVSAQLQQYGYDFSGKEGEGASGTHPDHEVGKIAQQLSGVALGYGDPPSTIVVEVIKTADGEQKKETSIPNYGGYKGYTGGSGSSGSSGKVASGGGKGGGSSGEGGGSGGGGGNKMCGPDGCFDSCQLGTMAAVAQCDMAMGKPVLNIIPGGGLIPQEKPLDKGLQSWIDCWFPPSTGLDGGKCPPNMDCPEGYSLSIDKTSGTCSCKPSGSGNVDPMMGFRGGPDDCQKVMCVDGSLNPCCTGGGANRGMPGQGGGFKNGARAPVQAPAQKIQPLRQKAFGREYNIYR